LAWFADIQPTTDAADFVEGVLTDGGMSVVYGESNSGKTFFASDLALRVALGWEWQGREVETGGVLYLACEGGYGIENRIAAFRQEYEVADAPPFACVRGSVNLRDRDADTARVVTTAAQMQQQTGIGVRLIVVDTLSRALAGGEENSSQDMGAVVQAVDLIRQQTGAHVLLVHHSGKDAAKGARGHSLLRAATDTEIEVSRPEGVEIGTATVKKQRDLPCDGLFSFTLRPVQLGTDRRGNTVTSCVVDPAEPTATNAKNTRRLTDDQRAFLEVVRNTIATYGETRTPMDGMPQVRAAPRNQLRNQLIEEGFADAELNRNQFRSRVQSYLNKLKGKGILGVSRDYVWEA
jgi:hypothetical protein